jgi:hypothetical protein
VTEKRERPKRKVCSRRGPAHTCCVRVWGRYMPAFSCPAFKDLSKRGLHFVVADSTPLRCRMCTMRCCSSAKARWRGLVQITIVRASRRGALGAAGKLALLSLPVAAATWSGVASATAAGAPAATAAAAGARAPETLSEVLRKAGRKAVGGGKSGAAAGVLQVHT